MKPTSIHYIPALDNTFMLSLGSDENNERCFFKDRIIGWEITYYQTHPERKGFNSVEPVLATGIPEDNEGQGFIIQYSNGLVHFEAMSDEMTEVAALKFMVKYLAGKKAKKEQLRNAKKLKGANA